jgi:hypothetical protein
MVNILITFAVSTIDYYGLENPEECYVNYSDYGEDDIRVLCATCDSKKHVREVKVVAQTLAAVKKFLEKFEKSLPGIENYVINGNDVSFRFNGENYSFVRNIIPLGKVIGKEYHENQMFDINACTEGDSWDLVDLYEEDQVDLEDPEAIAREILKHEEKIAELEKAKKVAEIKFAKKKALAELKKAQEKAIAELKAEQEKALAQLEATFLESA